MRIHKHKWSARVFGHKYWCAALLLGERVFLCVWLPVEGASEGWGTANAEQRTAGDRCVKTREGEWVCTRDFWQHCHLNSSSGTEPRFTAGLQLKTNYYLGDWRRSAMSELGSANPNAMWQACSNLSHNKPAYGQNCGELAVCQLRLATLK